MQRGNIVYIETFCLEMEAFEDNNENNNKKITELKSSLKVVELMLEHY